MNQPSEQELCRIADAIKLTGDMLQKNGSRALTVLSSWEQGPRSASLEPNSRGWRYDDEGEPIPNDTTGEAAIDPDLLRGKDMRLLALVHAIDQVSRDLRDLLYQACPQDTGALPGEPDTPAQISAAGWCVSCHRDGGYCEPVSMRPDGTRRYRDYCTWCGEFMATEARRRATEATGKKRKKKADKQQTLPPLELVKARHRGDRITQQMVDRLTRKKAS